MRETQRGDRFVVIDDFLDPAELTAARRMLHRASFESIESVVSPADDGRALRSRGTYFGPELGRPNVRGGRPAVYEKLGGVVHSEPGLYGRAERDWDRVSFAFWKYPAGSRLGWHNDAGQGRWGEFVLFLHERWPASWGGELLLLDVDAESLVRPDDAAPDNLLRRMEVLVERCPSNPVAIVPKPNRLVLVRTGTIHTISRVDPVAGDNLRCTLTGFVSAHGERETNRHGGRRMVTEVLAGSATR
ncbi:2OG-Fe(II) oxygenase family protein [Nocardia wallacei]|uniref:2OG-Fe(II) oxygenase family protein n=1 Tax=Nocardia wallacei TaxID=480035 RepID=UPI002455B6E9|nr:2OG-Fe(II) oxygenase family protein [Nocardia wallacei]